MDSRVCLTNIGQGLGGDRQTTFIWGILGGIESPFPHENTHTHTHSHMHPYGYINTYAFKPF